MSTIDAFTDQLLSNLADQPPASSLEPWRRPGLRCVRARITSLGGDVAVCELHDGTTAMLPVSEFPPHLRWAAGDELSALCQVDDGQQWLSCNRPELVVLVAHGYVPELRTGDVRVMGVARSPGVRTKLAVAPTVADLDPVTAVVGRAANRVRSIAQQLGGERLDVVAWHQDRSAYLRNAFAPASGPERVPCRPAGRLHRHCRPRLSSRPCGPQPWTQPPTPRRTPHRRPGG
jgi:hypothetical protein